MSFGQKKRELRPEKNEVRVEDTFSKNSNI